MECNTVSIQILVKLIVDTLEYSYIEIMELYKKIIDT